MPDPFSDGPNNHPSTLSVVDLKWCSSCSRAMRRDWKWDVCSHCRPRYGPAGPPRPKGAVLIPAAPLSQATHVPIPSPHPVHQVHCAACTITVHPKDMANLQFCVRCLKNGGSTNDLTSPPLIIPSQENHFKKEDAPRAMSHFNANGGPAKGLASLLFKVPSQDNHVEKGEAPRTMPHFNANGELIKSSNAHNVQKFPTHAALLPAPAPAPAPGIPPPASRLCRRWRHGCAGVILADASAAACAKCLTEGHPLHASSPSTSPSKPFKHVPERSHSLDASEVGVTSLVKKVLSALSMLIKMILRCSRDR
ncbi:hypothetical protein FIBSPDRAFT_367409 [Athelia psychrophila]|uniref:Uncharacterized protein n=1 Tax=Athelia psychrophila TaxID=1759441 RepID=A0A166P7B3_9AGAM|nr:hypothetical protein FIBSPDRAFT_367409 [Fibularhizoctonia sp. CBS 109695]